MVTRGTITIFLTSVFAGRSVITHAVFQNFWDVLTKQCLAIPNGGMSDVSNGRIYFSVPPPPPPQPPPQPTDRNLRVLSQLCMQAATPMTSSRSTITPVTTVTFPDEDSRSLGYKAYHTLINGRCNGSDSSQPRPVCLSFGHSVEGVLQKGPQCGFAALYMGARLWKMDSFSLDRLVNIGQQKGYTIQGELFSAYFMEDLAREFCYSQVVDTAKLCLNVIWECLLQGYLILVPYDSDKNYQPCLKRGHKAHWSLLTGCFIVLKHSCKPFLQNCFEQDLDEPSLFHTDIDEDHIDPEVRKNLVNNIEEIFVYTMQGKSHNRSKRRNVDIAPIDPDLVIVNTDRSPTNPDLIIINTEPSTKKTEQSTTTPDSTEDAYDIPENDVTQFRSGEANEIGP
ncbi:Hypothetical predicted protein [Octopus vulgaris]|uniref:Actin maturation protease n=1 Tax=Octopus vulgaris TaxID=6645 RepID=A0AA36FG50_OCTVU|nr:Hypothetical predicted protein [Octopus vulgaris]